MRIFFIADMSSFHAWRWLQWIQNSNDGSHEIHAYSLYPCPSYFLRPLEGVIFHGLQTTGGSSVGATHQSRLRRMLRPAAARALGLSHFVLQKRWEMQLLLTALKEGKVLRRLLAEVRPGVVHCEGVANSGYAGAWADYHPLSLSSRGNDFTFWAQASFLHRKFVELTMKRADLHIAECARDEALARTYGFGPAKRSLVSVLGVALEEFRFRPQHMSVRHRLAIPPDVPLIINVRGAGLWYNLDVFLKGIPLILAKFPEARFLVRLDGSGASSMVMRRLVDKLGIGENVRFFPWLDHSEMADYLAAADIMVSLSWADGVPVSMLEGMACGVVPVMSRQPAVMEWIEDGWNGCLVDPADPRQAAEAIVRLLTDREKMAQFRERNLELVRKGADVRVNAKRILDAMTSLASGGRG